MAEILFACSGCGVKLRFVNPDFAGKKMKCPECGAIGIIPAASAAAPASPTASESISKELTPGPGVGGQATAVTSRPLVRSEPAEGPEGRQKVKARRGKGFALVFAAVVVLVLGLGVAAAFFLGLFGTGAGAQTNNAEQRAKKQQQAAVAEREIAAAVAQTEGGQAAAKGGASVAFLSKGELRSGFSETVFSPDGQFLASVNNTMGIVHIWDLKTAKVLHDLGAHDDTCARLAFSPDGQTLAATSATTQGYQVWLWNVKDGKRRQTLPSKASQLKWVAFSPDGRWVLAAGEVGIRGGEGFQRWDAQTGQPVPYPKPKEMVGTSFAIRPDGKVLAVTGAEPNTSQIDFWDLETGARFARSIKASATWELTYSPDGRTLAYVENLNKTPSLKLVDVEAGTTVVAKVDAKGISRLAFSPDGKWLFLASGEIEGGWLHIWDVAGGKFQATLQTADSGIAQTLAVSPGGTFVATANYVGGPIVLWDLAALLQAGHVVKVPEDLARAAYVHRTGVRLQARLGRQATDDLVGQLAKLPGLTDLTIEHSVGLTEKGFAALGDLKDLRKLTWISASDAQLAHVRGLTGLQELDLTADFPRVTDAGLVHLSMLKNLKTLRIGNTRITDQGVEELKRAIPGLVVQRY